MADGPRTWGFPSDWPAATPEKAAAAHPVYRRSRLARRASTRTMLGFREATGADLQEALEIMLSERPANEPSSIAHC